MADQTSRHSVVIQAHYAVSNSDVPGGGSGCHHELMAESPEPVRIGLAGYGLGGRYFHAPLIASAANCEFLGVVTTSPERRGQVAGDFGVPAFDDLAGLARAGAEAVAISTPAATHIPLTQEALRLGLAVVCDKPFAPDANQARATVQLAEQLQVPLTV